MNIHRPLFFIFAISGFSGLIYESIWTHYLKLFLGHAAYAQTLVLAIFMGGMAAGSFICSRYSNRWKQLLLGYAVAEGAVGISALLFHPLFQGVVQYSYTDIIPRLSSPFTITAYKWLVSGLLILPQSVLLGMTFPLMSAALLRVFRNRTGSIIAMLYFTNSIGAVVGVLVTGFAMVRYLGLPGTICTAGAINIILAAAVIKLARNNETGAAQALPEVNEAPRSHRYRIFLLASLVTGMASFIYEIGWIRMLSLVLGSSTHAFELMLSAFILGLACGGIWIKRRIEAIASPLLFFAGVQVVMGLLALATLPLYGTTFDLMCWLIKTLPKTPAGYLLFNVSSHAIASAVMLPATFCAGMTLPLISHVLLRDGCGERSIGAVYGANTIGAIIGVFLAVHVGLPLFGTKGVMLLGAGLDLTVGLGVMWGLKATASRRLPLIATGFCCGALAVILFFVQLDPYKMASGVFRYGSIISAANHKVLFHEDGKTATVSLTLNDGTLSIRTNGKPDASVMMAPGGLPRPDEQTMALAAVIPLMLYPEARTAANIGLGSGITTNTLLSAEMLQQVDTIEIEQKMIDAARRFERFSQRVYTDPKSRVFLDDAKTFFSAHNKKYDIIVSEPSNPWVSGVSGLFTKEFYQLAKSHLAERGILVQWIQLYEINLRLVASIFKAIETTFPDYVVYATNYGDMVIVCRNGKIGRLDPTVLTRPVIADMLKRLNINGIQDLEMRCVGDQRMLSPLMTAFPVSPNSDFYPVVDQEATRCRFMGESATSLLSMATENLPLSETFSPGRSAWGDMVVTSDQYFPKSWAISEAKAAFRFLISGQMPVLSKKPATSALEDAVLLRDLFYRKTQQLEANRKIYLFNGGKNLIPFLTAAENSRVWQTMEQGPFAATLSPVEKCYVRLFKALGARDAAEILSSVKFLSQNDMDLTLTRKRYLTAAGMMAAMALDDRSTAQSLWEQWRKELFGNDTPGTVFLLLAAQSGVPLHPYLK